MNITMTQETPHPVYEVQWYAGTRDFDDIITWLRRTDLPDDLSLSFEGGLYRFRSRYERVYFAMGFDKASALMDDEPKLGTMVRLELSDVETRTLVHLLERAGDEFSNHGCNDFDLTTELKLDLPAAQAAGKELLKAMVASGAANEEQLEQSGRYLIDWQLFRHFEERVRTASK